MITGAFPRTRSYSKLLARYYKQKVPSDLYRERAVSIIRAVLHKLKRSGLDVGSDLMYMDDDIFYPFITDVDNLERGWLVRFYDNNYFVRNVIVKGKVSLKGIVKYVEEKLSLYEKLEDLGYDAYAVTLPGPLTLSSFSVYEGHLYESKMTLGYDYAKVLSEVAKIYHKRGLILEIHEPELCFLKPKELSAEVTGVYEELIKGIGNGAHIVTYFGGLKEEALSILPKNITIGLDVISASLGNEAIQELAKFRSVRLGIVDSRNTKLESVDETRNLVSMLLKRDVNVEFLSFNTMTEFLPEVVAFKKVRILGKLAKVVGNG